MKRCLLIFALVAFLGDKNVSAFGVQDFRDLDIFPVNTYKDRIIFYLDSDCDPSACLLSCSALHFGHGVCSANPRSCVCTSSGQVDLTSSNLRTGSSSTRVYQFGNDWTIFPELKCLANSACERSCGEQKFREGTCLKFNTQHPVSACACRRPTAALQKEATITAPFPVLPSKQRVAVYNNSVYLTTDLCQQSNCEKYCEKFNLANGVCHYYKGSSCKCDTGMNETRIVSDLQIKSYAGGIYTLNGWHLFEHDSSVECTDKLCAPVCQSWGFESEVACFPGKGITNACGCREYKSDVPSAEELAAARKDAEGSAAQLKAILPQFAVLLVLWCLQ